MNFTIAPSASPLNLNVDARALTDRIVGLLRTRIGAATERVRAMTDPERYQAARTSTQILAERGDVLQFGEDGETEEEADALATVVAVLSHQPGGIDFAGLHWCAYHELCTTNRPLPAFGRRETL